MRFVRDNLEAIKKSLEKRGSDYPLDKLLELDEEKRKIQKELENLRAYKNKESIEISKLKKENKEVSKEKIEELEEVKKRIDELEKKFNEIGNELNELLWRMPNILEEDVPIGKDDSENVEIKRVGEIKEKNIELSHDEILTRLGLLDLDQAANVSGARFYYLKGDLALLELSLIRFAVDELIKKGYELISPPLLMKREYYKGVTSLADFEEALYLATDPKEAREKSSLEHIEDELFLISTSEHPMAALYANHIFNKEDLPKKLVGYSPCFRREAGAHGKDTKGIFRVHQFYKVEQFIFSLPEESKAMHQELLKNSEEIFQKLGLPYRVVNICTGDIGIVASKKYDIEAYMPLQKKFREVVSCSNCTDWQALRLNIRYRENNELKHVHTLNSTAIAVERAIVGIIENYVNDDLSITIPKALVPYFGKEKIEPIKK